MAGTAVVTGLGVVSPVGKSVEDFWSALTAGTQGLSEISYFDASPYRNSKAGVVGEMEGAGEYGRGAAYALGACTEAAADASLEAGGDTGIVSASNFGASARSEADALARVDRMVRAWGDRAPDVDLSGFRSSVMREIRRKTARPRRTLWWMGIGMPFAAAAMIVFAVSLHWRALPEPDVPRAIVTTQAPAPVVQVAYVRPTSPTQGRQAETISVTFERSGELERQMAAQQAGQQSDAGFATASGGGRVAPVQLILAPPPI